MMLNRSGKVIKLKVAKLTVLCILAALMNILFTVFFRDFLGLPLYIDTVFNAAVTFAAGLVPGIVVAVLSWLILCIYWKSFHFYFLCSIAEVLLIAALKPSDRLFHKKSDDLAPKEKNIAFYTGLAAKLFLLYVVCAVSISILGGIINYVSDMVLKIHSQFYNVEDNFKLGLIMNNFPILATDILSRIQVNIVDRFIVIFGGYFISRGLVKLNRKDFINNVYSDKASQK